jgi:hypothetical protein
MLKRTINPSIDVVLGSQATGRDFDGVHSIPAAYLFDGNGREIFRVGGDPGPPGRHHMRRAELERAVGLLN